MANGQITISGWVTGIAGGSRQIGPLTINTSAAAFREEAVVVPLTSTSADGVRFYLTTETLTPVALSERDILLPATATAVILVPPSSAGSTTSVVLRGTTAGGVDDAEGIAISLTNPTLLSLHSTVDGFALMAVGAAITYTAIII